VWSGPEVPGLHAQDTRRVYEGLLGCAERSIWASTYAFFDGPKAFEVLARRMEMRPSLSVTLLLNIQRKRNDTSASDQLVQRFAERFWKTDWPGSVHPSVFYDPRSLDPEGAGGVFHAKAVVADDEAVFVTSANLTEAGSVTSESHSRSVGCTSIERPVATSIHRPSLLRRQGNSSAWKPS
jgi:phosphatidylserine/phosphatidylglycerophosphate/cardiolipin synthase-like enzyme